MRTTPPSTEPNNQDALVYALYLLGGADKDIDVEEIFLKCHELAPARMSWRTRPDLPDYKKASKALQSVEASTHVGLFNHTNQYARRLTIEGIKWVETYLDLLKQTYLVAPVKADKDNNIYERRRQEIRQSNVWKLFIENPSEVTLEDIAPVLQCSPASSIKTWNLRIIETKRTADVLQDSELLSFANFIEKLIQVR